MTVVAENPPAQPVDGLDIGVIDEPLLIFGGPYSNLEATQAVLDVAFEYRIPAHRIICTGDLCAYCADPRATVELVRDSHIHVISGNCDENLGQEADDCGCGFEEGSACDALSRQWYPFATASLDADSRAFLRELPKRILFEMNGRRFLVVHGGVEQINRFIFESDSDGEKRRELDVVGVDGIIAGHTGIPFSQIIDGRLWHNSGVVGMPANDGTPRAWFSLLSPQNGGIHVQYKALAYDHAKAAQKMRSHGLPEGYAVALETGLWPNLDILPEAEKLRTGVRLDSSQICFGKG